MRDEWSSFCSLIFLYGLFVLVSSVLRFCFSCLYFRVVPVPLPCVFLCSCSALSSLRLPHLFFDPPPGFFLVWAFRSCVVFAFDCVGVLFVLSCLPSPASSLGSAFPPCCSVFLAVLRCPVVTLSSPFFLILSLPLLPFLRGFGFGSGFFSCIPSFPFLRISCWLSVFCLLPFWFFCLRVSVVFGCRFGHVLLLLLCSHFCFVSSLACYPSFVGWFLTCFASSSVCCASGFLPVHSVSCFLPLDFLVLFCPLLPLSLCILCLRLFTVKLSCTFLYWEYLFRSYFSTPLLASCCLAASLLAVGVCPDVWCQLVCSVCSLLSLVRCSYPPAAFSFGSSQLHLFLRRVAGSPAAPMVTPPLRLPSQLWSSTSPVPLLRLRWFLLSFFSASLVLARFFRSFPALFIRPLLWLSFPPSGPLLLLCVLRLPLFPQGSVWGVWHFHFLIVSSFPGFFLPSLYYLGCGLSLAVSASWYFVDGSSVLLVLVNRRAFPLCVFLLSFPVVSVSIGSPVPFATWSSFGSNQVLLYLLFLSLIGLPSGVPFSFGVI